MWRDRLLAENRVWRSLASVSTLALLSATLTAASFLAIGRSLQVRISLKPLLVYSALAGLLFGLLWGGIALLQRFVLHVLLWRGGCVPWRLGRFLCYAADKKLLQRSGERFFFPHGQLRDRAIGNSAKRDRI